MTKEKCPEYDSIKCWQKCGVITCLQVTHHNKVKCPVVRTEKEEKEIEGV